MSTPERPNEEHLWKVIHFNTNGRNYTGTYWKTAAPESPPFLTALNNPCYLFFNAPRRKAFRIFSIHMYVLTLPLAIDDGTKPARVNLDLAVNVIKVGNSRAHAHGWNIIAHTRIFMNQADEGALAHDANDNGVRDAATDHIHALAATEWRSYDPEPHFIFPHGIDVGPHLMCDLDFGGYQNFNRITAGINVRFIFEYSIVPSKHYRKVFSR